MCFLNRGWLRPYATGYIGSNAQPKWTAHPPVAAFSEKGQVPKQKACPKGCFFGCFNRFSCHNWF